MDLQASRQPSLLIDRVTGRVEARRTIDRALIALLNLYAAASQPMRQRGLYKLCRLIGSTAWQGAMARIDIDPDAAVTFPADDPYWNRMLLTQYDHEPELAHFLRGIADLDYGFVDCGANIGYWSVFAASDRGGRKPVLAIEASRPTYDILARNIAPQADHIIALHRAVLDRSGIDVVLTDAAHEARGIAEDGAPSSSETVESIAIDDLLARHGWSERRLVVKLDVEGVERQALSGMERALNNDALVIYEDHGADASHALTRHVLVDRELQVHLLLDDETVPITGIEQLSEHKRDRTKGYNLTAIRNNSQWQDSFRS